MYYCAFKDWQQLTSESLLVWAFADPWLDTIGSNCSFLARFSTHSHFDFPESPKPVGIMTVLQIIIPAYQFLDVGFSADLQLLQDKCKLH